MKPWYHIYNVHFFIHIANSVDKREGTIIEDKKNTERKELNSQELLSDDAKTAEQILPTNVKSDLVSFKGAASFENDIKKDVVQHKHSLNQNGSNVFKELELVSSFGRKPGLITNHNKIETPPIVQRTNTADIPIANFQHSSTVNASVLKQGVWLESTGHKCVPDEG